MSAHAGATAALEPKARRSERSWRAPARTPALMLRVGGLAIPAVRPEGAAVVELEPGNRLGPLVLRSVEWPGVDASARAPSGAEVAPAPAADTAAAGAASGEDAGPAPELATPAGPTAPSVPSLAAAIAGPAIVASIDAPFVSGSAVLGMTTSGEPTGVVRVAGSIGVAGSHLADLRYDTSSWPSGGPLPVPSVAVQGEQLVVDLGAFIDLAGVQLMGPGLRPLGEGRWTVPLPADLLATLGTAPVGPAPVVVAGADPIALAEARLRDEPSERRPLDDPARTILEMLLGVDLAQIGVHVDGPAHDAAAAIGAQSFTIGAEAYFADGAFGTDTQELAAMLARAVEQAVEGVRRVVEPDTPMADPAQARSSVPPAAPEGAGLPQAPGAPETAPIIAETEATAAEAGTEEAAAQVAGAEAAAGEQGPGEAGPADAAAAEMAGAAAVGDAAAGGAPPPAVAATAIELIMPPAPTEPGPAQRERLAGVSRGAGSAARRAATLPSAEETTTAARGAVTEPVAETAARAEAAVAEALGERAEPSPAIVALCDRIRTSIRERRPVDEDDVKKTDSRKVAEEAGSSLNSGIQSDAQRVEGSYAPMNNPPAGAPALHPTEVVPPPATVAPPEIGATGGAPDPVPPENLSLDADRDASKARVEESGITKPTAQAVQEPPFTTVREGQAELEGLAETGPSQVATQQQAAIDKSAQDMAALQLQAIEVLNASRSATVGGVAKGQKTMVGSEEQQRAQISGRAQAIFAEAQTGVTAALGPLQTNAMAQWDAGVAHLSTEFHDHLAMVKRWIDDRHSGVGGWFVSGWDSLTGLPDEITNEYTKAEKAFGDGICELLLKISSDVNTVIAAAEALIESARERIDALFRDLPDGLKEWAAAEQEKFHGQLDGLHEQAAAARTTFVDGVSEKAVAAVAEVQAEIEQLREEAKGLIGKIADAIAAFIDDPVRAIIDGLLHIVGIPPARFWALVDKIAQVISDIADDPETFINNLVEGVKQGFEQFFANFGIHILQGFWEWLFSGLGSVGVQLPKDFSVGSLITFALQVMGITWPNIRKILVKHIGEENVALIEQAWQLVSMLIEKGPSGILDMIKERLSPEALLETILKAAVDYLIENLIKAVAVKLISMLNPAGAIYQAIMLIYTVLKWIFQNAARIFSLVETVVNAMADVIAGNLSSVANAVEKALAMLIPPVIDFFAEWLGFGDLPIKIAEIIKSLQQQVLAVIDEIIGFLVEQAKKLLAALGFGGEDDEEKQKGAEDTELGKTVRFTAAGEMHRLWIELTGTTATPMVASFQEDIATKLEAWTKEAPSKFPDGSEQRIEVDGLLATAKTELDELDKESDEAAPAYAAAQAGAGPAASPADPAATLPSDNAIESEEQTLAGTLNRLFVLFGGEDRATLLKKIGAGVPKLATNQTGVAHGNWWERVSTFKIGNEPQDPPVWPSQSVLAGTTSAAEAYIATESTHEQLLPWFTTAKGKRDADTQAFEDFSFVSAGTGHNVRQGFREALGDQAKAQLISLGIAAVEAATNTDASYKDNLKAHISAIDYVWDSPGGGRFTFWTDKIPDHTRYRPVQVVVTEKNGVRTTKYRTITGQEFTITAPVSNGLTLTVAGTGLRRMSGRGVTQDSPFFSSGQEFNRAHVIANEFGGSGYENGVNLVTTSAEYNQVVMRNAERLVGASIVAYARSKSIDPSEVVFDMAVTIRLGSLLDPVILATIKQQKWFSRDAGTELDEEIIAKIDGGEVHKDLLRVVAVDYSWSSTSPDGTLIRSTSIGADLWLLTEG